MLRVGASGEGPFTSGTQTFSMDKRKKQVSLCETAAAAAPEDRKVGVAAPKMFAFDAIFSNDDSQVSFLTVPKRLMTLPRIDSFSLLNATNTISCMLFCVNASL